VATFFPPPPGRRGFFCLFTFAVNLGRVVSQLRFGMWRTRACGFPQCGADFPALSVSAPTMAFFQSRGLRSWSQLVFMFLPRTGRPVRPPFSRYTALLGTKETRGSFTLSSCPPGVLCVFFFFLPFSHEGPPRFSLHLHNLTPQVLAYPPFTNPFVEGVLSPF